MTREQSWVKVLFMKIIKAARSGRKPALVLCLSILMLGALALTQGRPAYAAASRVEVENPLFGYPHLLPSPFTLPGGKLLLGTAVAFGVTDFLQIGTNLLADFYQNYNASLKLAIFENEVTAFALTGSFQRYNPSTFSASNPDEWINSYQPGAVVAVAILPKVAAFFGGSLNFSEQTLPGSNIDRSSLFRGATIESDLSWAYNPPTKRKDLGNVLATGVSYDLNYKLLGVGLSHYWPGFHLGFHYYIGAERNPVLPILQGGTVVYF